MTVLRVKYLSKPIGISVEIVSHRDRRMDAAMDLLIEARARMSYEEIEGRLRDRYRPVGRLVFDLDKGEEFFETMREIIARRAGDA